MQAEGNKDTHTGGRFLVSPLSNKGGRRSGYLVMRKLKPDRPSVNV